MNTGVLTAQCGSIRSQARAFVTEHSATTRRASGDAADRVFFRDMLFSKVFTSAPRSVMAAMLELGHVTLERLQLTNRVDQLETSSLLDVKTTPFIIIQLECQLDGVTAAFAN